MAYQESESIQWPDPQRIRNYKARNKTIRTIQSIFSNTGLLFTIFYVAVSTIVQPSLERQYNQRIELTAGALLEVRRLTNKLLRRLKSKNSSELELRSNAQEYADRCTQTESRYITDDFESDDDMHNDSDDNSITWNIISKKLVEVKDSLNRYNESCDRPSINMENLTFQSKLVVDQLSVAKDADKLGELSKTSVNNIREMKGWFVNGLVSL